MPSTPDATPPLAVGASRPGPVAILLWAAWFGMVGGLSELAAFLVKCHYLDPRNYNVSRHFPWMFPAAGLLVIGGPGLALALAARLRPGRVSAQVVLGILAFPAYLGFLSRWPVSTVACLVLAAGLARQTAWFLAARSRRFDRVARRSLVALVGLLVGTAAARYGHQAWAEHRAATHRPGSARGAKNVLLLVLDTVRAESLSLYGYRRDTSPHLARFAARGVRFDRAFSTAPWTAPSHASIFTGRWCHELSVGWNRPLDGTAPTLAEYLATRGYATAGFVANTTYCSYETGLDRGFTHYEDYDVSAWAVLLCSGVVRRGLAFADKHPALARRIGLVAGPSGSHRKTAARINQDFLRWLSRQGNRPFFAFLNYYDAHHPYLAPESEPGGSFGRRPASDADDRVLKSWWSLDKRRLDRHDLELARDAYDRCIAYLDRQVGWLLDELDRRGLLRETVVVITADHGEHLGEQHLFGHGCSLYRPELHVPLLVLAPGAEPTSRVVREPVSLRDLPATVVDLLGLGGSPFPGRALVPTWSTGRSGSRPPSGSVLSEADAPPEDDPNGGRSPVCRGPMVSAVAWGYHYIRNGDGREELFDLEGDPYEVHDLAGTPGAGPALRRFRSSLRR